MEILDLLNGDDDGADCEFEVSNTEGNAATGAECKDDEESEGETPPLHTTHLCTEKEKERGELDFFSLFFTREFRDSLRTWTNKMLKEKGKCGTYIELEIAMIFNPVSEIKELCSTKLFMSSPTFAATMARNRFENLRARFQVPTPGRVPVEHREQDQLRCTRRLRCQI
ncbi:hypothetical protein PHMEG_0003222 [Phytophthora megakarya]|uniref:Uncharacterized protein n=1 Tax=Phytophthora megakarya TaxID=4795 RepID=A0A225WX63_9STRA|nr:hypothetical protein PHMEG_0003222 [Phytophthora megakarya]